MEHFFRTYKSPCCIHDYKIRIIGWLNSSLWGLSLGMNWALCSLQRDIFNFFVKNTKKETLNFSYKWKKLKGKKSTRRNSARCLSISTCFYYYEGTLCSFTEILSFSLHKSPLLCIRTHEKLRLPSSMCKKTWTARSSERIRSIHYHAFDLIEQLRLLRVRRGSWKTI